MKPIPKRAFLSFDELCSKWGWTPEDLHDAIAEGEIIPAIILPFCFMEAEFDCVTPDIEIQQDQALRKSKKAILDETVTIFLHYPQRRPDSYSFTEYAHSTNPKEAKTIPAFLGRYGKGDYKQFRFSAGEIQRIECVANEEYTSVPSKSPYDEESTSLYRLLLGMAVDAYGFEWKAKKQENGIMAKLCASVEKAGLGSIKQDTARKYLLSAVEKVGWKPHKS
jgi:hypothetical protein